MFSSKMPSVLGLVSISPAVSAPASARSASTSTRPLAVEGTDTTSNPAIVAEAGLVP